jgi:RND family efflux transporter MFP subunit
VKNFTQQHPTILALTTLLFTVALLLAVSNNLIPFTLWTQHVIPQAPVSLTVVQLATINKPIQILRTGSIESSTSIPINAEFSGQLSEIYVREGQAVKAGEPLLKLQASSESIVNQTIGTSQQPQDNYDNALKEFNRYQKLFEVGAIPRRQLDIATAHLKEAKEILSNAQNTLQSSSTIINGSVTINAPIDGIVTSLSTAPGKAVQAGQQLVSLGSGQEVEIVVRLDQNDLYLVHLGTPVTVKESQQTIAGQVSRIYPQVEANQLPSFLAHIKLANNPAGLLKSGMSATIHIDTGKSAIVPAIPTSSIFQDSQGQNFIYLAADGKAIIQQIGIGETIGDFTEITSNLPEQSMVITSNINDIKDGTAITVMQK